MEVYVLELYELFNRDEFGKAGGFRLAAFGGVALTLRSVVGADEDGNPMLTFDLGHLSAFERHEYFEREAGPGFVERMSAFLMGCAANSSPEDSVSSLVDDVIGIDLTVVSSTFDQVDLLLSIHRDPEDLSFGTEVIALETSRTALAQAAIDVRRLIDVDGAGTGTWEPPLDWSRA